MHVEIGPRIYQVTSSAIALAGEEERIFAVSFLPVAKGGHGRFSEHDSTMRHEHLAAAAMRFVARALIAAAACRMRLAARAPRAATARSTTRPPTIGSR